MDQNAVPTEYAVASPDIVSEEFDGEFVVLDLSCGKYYSMDGAASSIWGAIVAGVSTKALAEAAGGVAGFDAQSIFRFAEQLVEYGCLARSETPGSASIDPALIDALSASGKPPTVEVFDDLAELIMSDPIHDVEETSGWPVRKPIAAE
jgi:hypothetical protein